MVGWAGYGPRLLPAALDNVDKMHPHFIVDAREGMETFQSEWG